MKVQWHTGNGFGSQCSVIAVVSLWFVEAISKQKKNLTQALLPLLALLGDATHESLFL